MFLFRGVARLSDLPRSCRGRLQIQEAGSGVHAVNGLWSKHNIPAVSMHVTPTHLNRTTLYGASSLCLPQHWREGGARLPAAADLVGGCGEDLPQPTTHRPAHGLLWPKAVTQLIGQLMNMPENLQLLRFHVVHLGCPCSHRSQPYLSIISTCQSYLHNIPGYDLPSVSLTTDQQSQPIYIQCPPWTDSFNLLMPQDFT